MTRDLQILHKKSQHRLNLEIIDKSVGSAKFLNKRLIVRGIAIKNQKILVVYPKNNQLYGTPGGGVDKGESLEEALRREMLEEVGAERIEIIDYIGKMTGYRKSFHLDSAFIPEHHFYLIKIKKYGQQKLMPYEKKLELQYDFIDIDDVIKSNEKALKTRNLKFMDFYFNQTILLKEIRKLFFNH